MTTLPALLGNPATAGNWNLVPEHSAVRFKNKTLWGLASVNGSFTDVSGAGQITADGAVTGRVDVRVDSVRTGIKKRDEHLRSSDYFDAGKYPQISLVLTGLTPTGERTADLIGELTVRGTSRPLNLPATIDQPGDGRLRITAQTTVDRTSFGVDGNMAGMIPPTTTLIADVIFVKAK